MTGELGGVKGNAGGGSKLRSILPAMLVGLLGFIVTVDLRVQQRAADELAGRRDELAQIAAARQRTTTQLESDLARLRARLDALAARADDESLRELRALSEELAIATGTTQVTGPGLLVRLSDASGDNAAFEESDVQIQDVDVRSVVNDLWAAGAEAIAINGQRLVATTAIRNAGAAVLVNFKVLTSPYRIAAVGDRARMRAAFDASETAKHFRRWTRIFGLGFDVSEHGRLDLPPYGGSIQTKEARIARAKGEG